MKRRRNPIVLAALLAVTGTTPAQDYPVRPIRLVVSMPPGGAQDATTRVVAHKLAEVFGRQVVVDNRAGAGGTIGAEMVARAAPDGYTLLSGSFSTHVVAPIVRAKIPYDPVNDFAPISLFAMVHNVLVAHPSFPPNTVRELIALAKAKPGVVDIGSAGVGTTSHLAGALFVSMARINLTHVPYKGGGPAFVALVAGEIPVFLGPMTAAIPLIKAGRLKALAVGGSKRSQLLPAVPTVAESGVPGYASSGWYGLLAPEKTPAVIVSKLHSATRTAVNAPEVRQQLTQLGGDAVTNTPGEFGSFIRNELTTYEKMIKEAGIKAE